MPAPADLADSAASRDSADPAGSTDAAAGTGLYLFCVAACDPSRIGGEGLSHAPLEVIECEGLVAVACAVSLSEWTGPGAEERLGDIAWLGPRALQHEAVIESAMAHGPVLPLRFGSLFSSAAGVRAWLSATGPRILGFLRGSAAACEEWAVKGWLRPEPAAAARLAADPRFQALPASPGARYLREQKLRQEVERSLRAWARGVGEDLANELLELGVEVRPLRVLGGQGSDKSGDKSSDKSSARAKEVTFHFALWVPRPLLDPVKQRIESLHAELQEQGVTLDLTGPWPPYSFCPQLADAGREGEDADAETSG